MKELNEISFKNASRKATFEASTSRRTIFSSKNKEIAHQTTTNKGKEVEKDNQEAVVEKKTEANVKKKDQNPYSRPFKGVCSRCSQIRHPSNACTQCKTVTFIDEEDEDSFENIKESEEDVEMIVRDDGDHVSCVLQRVLFTPKG